jgi:hypothetical protein
MTLKAIEMQVALPRTFDAGKIQHQMQHQGQVLNENASQMVHKDAIKKRQTVIQNTGKQNIALKKESEKHGKHGKKRNKNQQSDKEELPNKTHPYKGKSIDFSG